MKIFLTGANGMVGAAISKVLAHSSHQTLATGRGVCRLPTSSMSGTLSYLQLELTSPKEVREAILGFIPDVIIHAAAMTQVDECEMNKEICYTVNVEATAVLVAAAEQVGSRFCYLSTDFVFDGKSGPYKESDQTNPINYYGKTKETAEQILVNSQLSWSIARTVLLYGKADHINRSNFIYWVKNNLEAGKKIQVVNDQIRTPTFIPDFVDGIIKMVETSVEGIYHISGEHIMTPFAMAIAVADHLHLDKSLISPVDAATFTQPGKRPLKTGFKIDKAKMEIGYSPTSFSDSLSLIF